MRDLIPHQYHIFVVIGAIALCTVLTLLVTATTATRSFKRHFDETGLTPEQIADRDAKEATAMLIINIAIALIIWVAVLMLIGFISAMVTLGGHVAVIGLLGQYCSYKLRQRK